MASQTVESIQSINHHFENNPEIYGIIPLTDIKNYGVAYRPPKSISSFVAGFKSSATKQINLLNRTPGFMVWQERFHDRIIRNKGEYHRIAKYIQKNISRWSDERSE
ncbi:MAG: hypothetical protein Q7J34_00680 [Bacteroidales bacterium]|jgi:hypothetical protein|nr:hypothetical protein [Bacteroidales bacterium]